MESNEPRTDKIFEKLRSLNSNVLELATELTSKSTASEAILILSVMLYGNDEEESKRFYAIANTTLSFLVAANYIQFKETDC